VYERAKRVTDFVVVSAALVLLSPVLFLAAMGILIASPGPVLYRARRVGRNGAPFVMYKFRTMRTVAVPNASPITAADDPRVFTFGAWLRTSKIDELPQLVNILKGEMAIVGPRPEDPDIVRDYYSDGDLETLNVLPGLTSPGSIYYFTRGEQCLGSEDTVREYVETLLPLKLALDRVYVREASFAYDLAIVLRTVGALLSRLLGRSSFPDPPEMGRAARFLDANAALLGNSTTSSGV
jgi:lipopolysaccharide/colanic/teichoic acid biosynthesis glycosyltransferase